MLTKEASCRRQSAVAGRGATKDPPGVTKSKKNQQTQPRHGSIRIVDVGFFPKSPNGFKRTTACLTAHCLATSPMARGHCSGFPPRLFGAMASLARERHPAVGSSIFLLPFLARTAHEVVILFFSGFDGFDLTACF